MLGCSAHDEGCSHAAVRPCPAVVNGCLAALFGLSTKHLPRLHKRASTVVRLRIMVSGIVAVRRSGRGRQYVDVARMVIAVPSGGVVG